MEWRAAAAFGLEGVVADELRVMGMRGVKAYNGGVDFEGGMADGFSANLWLRCADRVLLKLGEGTPRTFDELFEMVKALPWEDVLPGNAAFPVRAKCVRSQLMSPSDCQKIVKKAIVERMKLHTGADWMPEDGPVYAVDLALHSDNAVITLDASGDALNRRGYRTWNGEAPLRETLAAAIVRLSPWHIGEPLHDPCCGTGTLPIEAAFMALDRAPGLNRAFACEAWPQLDSADVARIRDEAQSRFHAHDADTLPISGSDIDPEALTLARRHIAQAGLEGRLSVNKCDLREFRPEYPSGAFLANPPYGERLGDRRAAEDVIRALREMKNRCPGWSLSAISSHPGFERIYGRKPNKRRRLYNGRIECELLTFFRDVPGRV